MAVRKTTFTFGTALANSPKGSFLGNNFDLQTLAIDPVTMTPTKVIAKDMNGASIEIYGKSLKLAADGSATGTVTKVVFLDNAGAALTTVTNVNIHAGKLLAAYDRGGMWSMMSLLNRGNDVIKGTDGNDDIIMGDNSGNDTIIAGKGDDWVRGSAGNNAIFGGLGDDVLSFEETFYDQTAYRGVNVNAVKGTVSNSWGGVDRITGFENYVGSIYSDVFLGSKLDETFQGLSGADIIKGGTGFDFADYSHDAQYNGYQGITVNLAATVTVGTAVYGTVVDGFGFTDRVSGIEAFIGTAFNDSFTGDAADNRFKGGQGEDSYDGGLGMDTLDFRAPYVIGLNQTGIYVDLTKTQDQITTDGFGNTETAISIESIRGSFLADYIRLGASDGNARGYSGEDMILAGNGVNLLEGGEDSDKFAFDLESLQNGFVKIADNPGKFDTIVDFEVGNDKIDFSTIGNVPLAFSGSAFTGAGNEVIFVTEGGNTRIDIDINGDKVADATLYLEGVKALTAGDFIL